MALDRLAYAVLMFRRVASVLLVLALAGGCGGTDEPAPPPDPYPNTQEGAERLALDLRNATTDDLLLSLKPATEDYRAFFDEATAAKAESHYESLWSGSLPPAMGTDPDQTEVRLWRATTDDIAAWTPEVEAVFPGGYEDLGPHLRPGVTVCKWDYVRPGENAGISFNGLAHVNGHWKVFFKPWYVLDAA